MIGDRPVTKLQPKDRGVAFVFQSYALYPHMTCRDNLTTRLVMSDQSWVARSRIVRRRSSVVRGKRQAIADRVAATADLLQMTPYLDRRPSALSGGQQKRVALGRALIREPDVFLLDEPLANLDAGLRNRTRSEL